MGSYIEDLRTLMLHQFRSSAGLAAVVLTAVVFAILGLASAQYPAGYPNPYAPQMAPTPQLPRPAQRIGGFSGNPFANSGVPPTGLPLGTRSSSVAAPRFSTGSPMAHRPTQKPFSNVSMPGPLVSSRDAARIEVARGLWWY